VTESDLPQIVQRFIRRHITSVEAVEVLLLLHRNPHREWTAQQVSKELYSQPEAAQFRLDDLAKRGLCRKGEDGFRYAPTDGHLGAAVDAVAEAYARRRVRLISLIFAPPGRAGRSVTDSFRPRGGER
jgi:hypothetical protein